MSSNMMMGQVNEFRYGDVLLTHWVAKSRARSIQVVSCHSIFLSFHYLSFGLPSLVSSLSVASTK
jgi:hypothetical protein